MVRIDFFSAHQIMTESCNGARCINLGVSSCTILTNQLMLFTTEKVSSLDLERLNLLNVKPDAK